MIGLVIFFLSLVFYYVFLFLVVRFLFLLFRQTFRIFKLKRTIKNLAKNKCVKVEERRSVFEIIFGNKGSLDFVITVDDCKYLISIISFIYGKRRLRWNVEKAVDSDLMYIEVNFYSGMLYKNYKNAGKEANFLSFNKFETTLERHRLLLNDVVCNDKIKNVLLFAYAPEHLTYSDTKFKFLYSGDIVSGYKVMFLNDLKKEIETILSAENLH